MCQKKNTLLANTRAKVTKNIEIVNEIAEKFLPRLSFYHKCNKSLASFAPHALKGQKLLAQGNGHKQHALKGQKLLAQGNGHKQHALKGQKLLAQGSALGIMPICKAPCKGKSFVNCHEF